MLERAAPALGCDLLVFDLDGTLIDSELDLANSVNASLASLARPQLSRAIIAGFVGDGAATLISRALRASGGSDESTQQQALSFFLAYYREHKLDNTQVYPGVREALQAIRAASPLLPMAVLTNKPVRPSVAICKGLHLFDYFFAIQGGDSLPSKKPDPAGLITLMQQASGHLGRAIDPRRTVLIGDSHVDVATARAAGTLSLGCTFGLSPHSVSAALPDALVDTPAAWLPALQQLLSS